MSENDNEQILDDNSKITFNHSLYWTIMGIVMIIWGIYFINKIYTINN